MVITVAQRKGGNLKSTTVGAYASLASEAGLKTLIFDLDSQKGEGAGNLAMQFGSMEGKPTFLDLFRKNKFNPVEVRPNLFLAFGGEDLESIKNEMTLAVMSGKLTSLAFVVREALDPIRNEYDLIILDTPPTPSPFSSSMLESADIVVAPILPEAYSVIAFNELRQELDQLGGVRKFFIQPSKIDARTRMTKKLRTDIAPAFGDAWLPEIPVLAEMGELPLDGKTIIEANPKSIVSKSYKESFRRIIS